jgi:hypothetical protein
MDVDMKSRAERGKEDSIGGVLIGKEGSKLIKGGKGKAKGKGKGRDGVPSLARTHAQNDGWTSLRGGDREMCTSSSEDEDEGELDLARLLVPPKRQNSIRSLRRHLHGPLQPSSSRGMTPSSSSTRSESRSAVGNARGRESRRAGWDYEHRDRDEDGDEDWRRGMLGRGRGSLKARHGRGIRDEGEMFDGLFLGTDTTGSGAGTKRRRGIPGAWATES